ncbi:trypsin-like peptidase domain-containing protein [Candidatus Bathyarchaeota archaeon]|nr:trypsin-like peptidase domain-containing protein [Candidatus Bathyarchaeota archaeon]
MSRHEDNAPTLKSLLILSLILYLGSISILGFTIKEMQRTINERNKQITELSSQLSQIYNELSSLKEKIKAYNTSAIFSYERIYEKIKDSVVVVRGKIIAQFSPFWKEYSSVQGSGFIYNHTGRIIVITNNHVVDGAVNITVSLLDGDTYPARVIGKDPYSDLAILSVEAPPHKLKPAIIVSSSTLKVGDPVIAVGSPFGLAGSITTGVVSQLGRTISESQTGGYPIADVIQISTPINPGNSGGPLLNIFGEVVGITTAIIKNAQGVGFAIPSDTILRELPYLIEGKRYPHPWLGVVGTDMNFDLARIMNVNVTYGWLIVEVFPDSPAEKAGLRGGSQTVFVDGRSIKIGGDIIIMINGTRIRNGDDLSTYLERNTSPRDKIKITVVRSGKMKDIIVELGSRPYPHT